MATTPTTPGAIRDRMLTVIEALTPTSATNVPFLRHVSETNGNYIEWAETNPAAAFRRVDVRYSGAEEAPETSSGVEEEHQRTFTVTIAYPLDTRYGADLSLDRDDIIAEDQFKIEKAIGMLGKANFTGPTYPDATWLRDGSGADRQAGEACDFLILTLRYAYILDVT